MVGQGQTTRGAVLLAVLMMAALLSFPLGSAPPPDKCSPWPECKDGGGGEPTPANPAIAYTTNGKRLWVMDADGSHQTQIYATVDTIGKPTWAPDGSAIAFLAGSPSEQLWRIDFSVVDGVPVGSNPTMLYSSIYFSPEWSPAGDVIAFPAYAYDPAIGYDTPRLLLTIPAAGGTTTTLYTAPEGSRITSPTWSPDAKSIAFMETDDMASPSVHRMQVLDVENLGNLPTTVYGPMTSYFYNLEWGKSAGSTHIAFGRSDGIYTMDISAENPTPKLVQGGDSRFPSWSPDDSQMAYMSWTPPPKGKKMDIKIWVEDLDGTGEGDRTELVKGWKLDWVRCDPCPW